MAIWSTRGRSRSVRQLEPATRSSFADAKLPYPERLRAAQLDTGMKDAAAVGGRDPGRKPVAVTVMDFFFMGRQHGLGRGEKVARRIEAAIAERRALVIVSATAARACRKDPVADADGQTSALLARLQQQRLPYVSILTEPSTPACWRRTSLGDVIVAEPGALVGFAGARVIRQTIGRTWPPGFQRAEFVLEKGFIDRIVHRKQMREESGQLLEYFWRSDARLRTRRRRLAARRDAPPRAPAASPADPLIQ